MPDKDYSKGKIYRIWCITGESDDVYIGSTIQSLAKCWGGHKTASKSTTAQHYRLYQIIADNWGDWKIELIELYPCASKMELERREGELIRETGTLNEKIAGRTDKEYHQDNKDKLNEMSRQYHQANKDKLNGAHRQYYQDNKDKLKEMSRQRYHKKKAEAQTQAHLVFNKTSPLLD